MTNRRDGSMAVLIQGAPKDVRAQTADYLDKVGRDAGHILGNDHGMSTECVV